jgi:hypothetical protein
MAAPQRFGALRFPDTCFKSWRSTATPCPRGTVLVLDSSSGTQLTVVQGDGTRLERLAFDTEGRLAMGWASGRVDRIEIPGQ